MKEFVANVEERGTLRIHPRSNVAKNYSSLHNYGDLEKNSENANDRSTMNKSTTVKDITTIMKTCNHIK